VANILSRGIGARKITPGEKERRRDQKKKNVRETTPGGKNLNAVLPQRNLNHCCRFYPLRRLCQQERAVRRKRKSKGKGRDFFPVNGCRCMLFGTKKRRMRSSTEKG